MPVTILGKAYPAALEKNVIRAFDTNTVVNAGVEPATMAALLFYNIYYIINIKNNQEQQ
jgi:hypothetical protein